MNLLQLILNHKSVIATDYIQNVHMYIPIKTSESLWKNY